MLYTLVLICLNSYGANHLDTATFVHGHKIVILLCPLTEMLYFTIQTKL